MDLALTGKTALVTGASRGIGRATVLALRAEGARVVGVARSVTPELGEAVAADLATAEGARHAVGTALELLGGLDILVNNVGAGDTDGMTLGGFLDTGDEQWAGLLDRNLFSAVWTSRAALPSLLERRGAIVNVSSVNARVPSTGPVGYSEAKAALTAFGKRLSEEFGPRGVRVNTVSPGVTGSPLWRDPEGFGGAVAAADGIMHDQLLAALPQQAGITTGRITEPEEIAAVITFLASGRAGNLVGADVVVDGGMIKTG